MQKLPNMRHIKKIAVNYIKKAVKRGHVPNYEELNERFRIRILRITTKELYLKAGLKFLELTQVKRPNRSNDILKKELIDYIIRCEKNEHYPSRRELEHQFNIRLSMFKNIKELYRKARVHYKQINNQSIKVKKARLLEKIVINNLKELKVTLISKRDTHERGIDILAKDSANRLIGIELKAYNKHERIKKRNIEQIKRWLKKNEFYKVFLITTTSKIETKIKIPKKICITTYDDLMKMCNKNELISLDYIRNSSIHVDTKEHELKRELIKRFITKNYKNNDEIKISDINRALKLEVYTYFKSQLELYKYCCLLPPMNLLNRGKINSSGLSLKYYNIWKSKIIDYIQKEIAKGHYPSGANINKNFGISIWNYAKVNALYKEAGFMPYHKRTIRFKPPTVSNEICEIRHLDAY